MNAFLFPGQGSQSVGMGSAWLEQYPELNEYFDIATKVLSRDLKTLCLDGPQDELTQTTNAQPALLTVGVICAQVAKKRGLEPQMLAGHSLGEYSALVAGGALSFEEALRLVDQRAQLMAQAKSGGMTAVIGLDDAGIEELLQDAGKKGTIVAANFNAPGQVVLSGDSIAVDEARPLAKSHGARMAIALEVSGAFHSPLMQEAAQEMEALLESAPFEDTQIPIYQNSTGRAATDAKELRAALIAQMTGAVRWSQSVEAMISDGASQFYELGPGKVLAGLCRRINKKVPCETADSWIA